MAPSSPMDPQWRLLAVCTLVLYIKFLLTTMIQGRRGFQAGTRLPEDALLPMAKDLLPSDISDANNDEQREVIEGDVRWKRIVQNDLESLPLAVAVFTIAMLAGSDVRVNRIALVVYTVARIFHTVFFAYKKSLLRMVTWIMSVVCILTAGVNGASTVIDHE